MVKQPELDVSEAVALVNARATDVVGRLGPNPSQTGGKLKVDLKTDLVTGSNDSNREGSLTLNLYGVPRDVKDDANYAFHIGVTMNATFQWRPSSGVPNFEAVPRDCSVYECLFVMALSEARHIAVAMGFGPLKVDPYIHTHLQQETLAVAAQAVLAGRAPAETEKTAKVVRKARSAQKS